MRANTLVIVACTSMFFRHISGTQSNKILKNIEFLILISLLRWKWEYLWDKVLMWRTEAEMLKRLVSICTEVDFWTWIYTGLLHTLSEIFCLCWTCYVYTMAQEMERKTGTFAVGVGSVSSQARHCSSLRPWTFLPASVQKHLLLSQWDSGTEWPELSPLYTSF